MGAPIVGRGSISEALEVVWKILMSNSMSVGERMAFIRSSHGFMIPKGQGSALYDSIH